ncbi:LacI family DNA-binding transcriptional regulator [Maritalea sp.]|jgi:LacI family transcriptional regulator|uniref:LacI family DNA-binding transcriptional regulator n=1 Tax=Maritalea sp. TaxID=2003361 RepID=UPI0039E36F46
MVTIKDVSTRAGVSKSTVSRFIADNGYVSDEKRKAIETAINELNYRPNKMARGLRSNRSDIIGLVVVDVASPFYAQLAGGVQSACREAGKSLLVTSGYAEQESESRAIIELVDRSCDGLILYLENPMDDAVAELVQKAKLPVVVIGSDPYVVAQASVSVDNKAGAYQSMKMLLDKGHREIVHFNGPLDFRDARDRLDGVALALGEVGLQLSDIIVRHGAFSDQFGYDATMDLLQSTRKFTAIVAGDDDIAAGCMLALKHNNINVPNEVSIIGFDDNFHARHLTPSLTTNRQPIVKMGQVAVEMLLQLLLKMPVADQNVVLKTELIERESVARISS